MNEHAGLGCAISALIVVAFAAIFHEEERKTIAKQVTVQPSPTIRPIPPVQHAGNSPRSASPSPPPVVGSETSTPAKSSMTIEAINPPKPAVSLASSKSPDRISNHKTSVRSPQPNLMPSQPIGDGVRQSASGSARIKPVDRLRAGSTRDSTTIVLKGERLGDVAARIYGTRDAASRLWRANRDQLPTVDSTVAEGWLLRTP